MTDVNAKHLDGAGLSHVFGKLKGVLGDVESAPYTEVEWVESDGTQYVYLDWKPPVATWGFEADFIIRNAFNTSVGAWRSDTNVNGYGNVFGTRNSSTVNDIQLGTYGSTGILRHGSNSYTTSGILKTDKTRQQVSLKGTSLRRGDGTTVTVTRTSETANKPYANMVVFGIHEGIRRGGTGNVAQLGTVRIYSLKFYDGTTLKVDLVGAIRNRDGMTGLYDKVKGHFYPAQGMTYGDAVGTLGVPDTVEYGLLKRDIITYVDNRTNTRMLNATVPELTSLEDGQQLTVIYSAAITASTQTTELAGWDDTSSNSNLYLKVTLADGSKTEWIPCYYGNGSRLTSHYGAGTPILMTYRENVFYNATTTAAGTAVLRGWWADPNYNTDDVYTRYSDTLLAGLNGVKRYSLNMRDANGNWTSIMNEDNNANATGKTAYAGGLMLGNVLYHNSGSNIAAGGNTGQMKESHGGVDLRYDVNGVTNASGTTELQLRKPVYLVGTVHSDGLFYLDQTKWWTQTSFEEGKVYVQVGTAYSSYYAIFLSVNNPAYIYDGTKLIDFSPIEVGCRNLLANTSGEAITYTGHGGYFDLSLTDWAKANIKTNDILTLSFDACSSTSHWIDFYWRSASTSYNSAQYFYPAFQINSSISHYTVSSESGFDIDDSGILYLRLRNNSSSHTGSVPELDITISNLKLEKGNKATDWTPAPEDFDSRITAAESKLSGIAAGAEVNQNTFSNVKVGSTTIAADAKTDTLELAGSNVTLTPDATNDKVTIGITASNVTTALGTLPVANGGTGQTTAQAAANSLLGALDNTSGQSTDFTDNTSIITTNVSGTTGTYYHRKASLMWNYIASKLSGFGFYDKYIRTQPENSPVIIPFINNDIAFLLKRGGSAVVTYDGTVKNVDISNAFDGSPSYWGITYTGTTEIVIELTLHKTFSWTNRLYIDFGVWWTKIIKVEVMNSGTTYPNDTWTTKLDTTTNTLGFVSVNVTHTPVGAANAGGGFNKVRLTFSFANGASSTSIFRIAQIGILNYGSLGLRETYMSRGIDDSVLRNITPTTTNVYDLGSSSLKWAHVYATSFNGALTGNVTGNVSGTAANVTGVVAADHGGTGQTSLAAARNAMGLGNTTGALPVANGGTGATSAANARTNLDVPPTSHASSATTYGTGTDANYGHVKLSGATNSTSGTSGGTAATPSAVKTAYDLANTANGTANTALSGVNGTLIYDHTYTIANGVATFTAHVYCKGQEVTSNYQDSAFSWSYRLSDAISETGTPSVVSLGTGKTKTINITTLGLGGHVIGTFTTD